MEQIWRELDSQVGKSEGCPFWEGLYTACQVSTHSIGRQSNYYLKGRQ